MPPDVGMTALEAYAWFGALLGLILAGVALIGWWQLRDRGER